MRRDRSLNIGSRVLAKSQPRPCRRFVACIVVISTVVATAGLFFPSPAGAVCTAPSVTLSTNMTVVDANTPSATLTVQVSSALCSPYVLTIYDDLGAQKLYRNYTYSGTSWTVAVSPGNNLTRTYTAYVAQDAPQHGPPTVDVRSTSAPVYGSEHRLGRYGHVDHQPHPDRRQQHVCDVDR